MGRKRAKSKLQDAEGLVEEKRNPNATDFSILTLGEFGRTLSKVMRDIEKCGNTPGEKGLVWSSTLRRLLQSRCDPPIQLWWALTALEKSVQLGNDAQEPLLQGSATMIFVSKLLVTLKALSSMNASGSSTIAGMAPAIALLHDVVTLLHKSVGVQDVEIKDSESVDGKRIRKLVRKLRETIREILSFIVVSHRRDFPEFKCATTLPSVAQAAFVKPFHSFYPTFPLVSKNMFKVLNKDKLNPAVIAEVVSVQVIILQLIVEAIDWRSRLKKQKKGVSEGHEEFLEKLRPLARHSVWTGRTLSIPEMLLDTLLEKRLPCGELMDDKEEMLVRECLYEAVLVDPPSFALLEKEGSSAEQNGDLQSVLFMKKLAVGRRAVQIFRSREDRYRADTFSRRISTWHAPPQLMKWLQGQKKHLLPISALLDQQAFLTWVASTSDEVAFKSIFDRCVSNLSPKVTVDQANGENKVDLGDEMEEVESMFFVDTAGETKGEETVDADADLAFTAAARSIGRTSERHSKGLGPIYSRLSQGGGAMEMQRGKKFVDELEDSDSDSDAEDSIMVENASDAEDTLMGETVSSSGDEALGSLKKKGKRVGKKSTEKELSKASNAKGEEENGEKNISAESKEVFNRTGEDQVIPALMMQISKTEGIHGSEENDPVLRDAQLEPSELAEGVLSVKDGKKIVVGSKSVLDKQADVEVTPVLMTSPRSKKRSPDVTADKVVQIMETVSSRIVTQTMRARETPCTSNVDILITPVKETLTVETSTTPVVGVTEANQVTQEGLSLLSVGKTPGKSKRGRKNAIPAESSEIREPLPSPLTISTESNAGVDESAPLTNPTLNKTPSKRKRGRKGVADDKSEAVETLPSPGVQRENRGETQEAPAPVARSPSDAPSTGERDRTISGKTVETLLIPAVTTPDGEGKVPGPQAHMLASTDTPSQSKQGSTVATDKGPKTKDTSQPAISHTTEKDVELQERKPPTAAGKHSTKSVEGSDVMAGKGPEANDSLPPSAVSNSKGNPPSVTPSVTRLSGSESRASMDVDQKVSEEKSFFGATSSDVIGMTLPPWEKNSEILESPPSSVSPSSKRGKRGSKNGQDVSSDPAATPRRIATRGTTPHIVIEKRVEEEDLAPIVLVTPHKTPRKSRRKVTIQDPLQKVEEETEISAPTPLGSPSAGRRGTIEATPSRDGETPEAMAPPPSTSKKGTAKSKVAKIQATEETPVQATPSRGKKSASARAVSDDKEEDFQPTPSRVKKGPKAKIATDEDILDTQPPPVLATVGRGKKSTRVKVVTTDDIDEKPIPSAQATPGRGTKRSKPQVVTDDEIDETPAPSVQATTGRGRKSTKVKAVNDDEDANTPALSVQATPGRGRKGVQAITVTLEEFDDKVISSLEATPSKGRKSTKVKVVTENEAGETPTPSVQATPSRGKKGTKVVAFTDDEIDEIPTFSVQATPARGKKSLKLKATDEDLDDAPVQATPSRGKKSINETDVESDEWVPPSSQKTPRKKTRATSQPPEEDQDMLETQSAATAGFTPRRSKRGSSAAEVTGESVDMALSPYRSSRKKKTKLPVIVDLDDE